MTNPTDDAAAVASGTPRSKAIMAMIRALPLATVEHFFALRDGAQIAIEEMERELMAERLRADAAEEALTGFKGELYR